MKEDLVICYSYTGNTFHVAEEIIRQTGGTLCEIYPKQPYPTNFTQLLEQARKEIELGKQINLFPMKEKPEDYEVIYIGTPNWCGTIAPAVTSWIAQNNLDGKIIAPFYTHCGGGHGNIEEDVRALCPKSVVVKGIGIVNDGGPGLSKQMESWLKEIKVEQLERRKNYDEEKNENIMHVVGDWNDRDAGRMSR